MDFLVLIIFYVLPTLLALGATLYTLYDLYEANEGVFTLEDLTVSMLGLVAAVIPLLNFLVLFILADNSKIFQKEIDLSKLFQIPTMPQLFTVLVVVTLVSFVATGLTAFITLWLLFIAVIAGILFILLDPQEDTLVIFLAGITYALTPRSNVTGLIVASTLLHLAVMWVLLSSVSINWIVVLTLQVLYVTNMSMAGTLGYLDAEEKEEK